MGGHEACRCSTKTTFWTKSDFYIFQYLSIRNQLVNVVASDWLEHRMCEGIACAKHAPGMGRYEALHTSINSSPYTPPSSLSLWRCRIPRDIAVVPKIVVNRCTHKIWQPCLPSPPLTEALVENHAFCRILDLNKHADRKSFILVRNELIKKRKKKSNTVHRNLFVIRAC